MEERHASTVATEQTSATANRRDNSVLGMSILIFLFVCVIFRRV